MVIAFISLVFIIAASSLAGYAFARVEFPGRDFIYFLFIFIFAVPLVVFLVPIYLFMSHLKLINSLWAVILPYAALNISLPIIIMRATFKSIPVELENAAKIDGCNFFQLFFGILLPLAKAGITSSLVFSFIAVWEEFLFASVLLSKTNNTTISVGINFLKEEAQSWAFGTLGAVVILSIIPGLIIFLLGRRYYVSAFLQGSLKG